MSSLLPLLLCILIQIPCYSCVNPSTFYCQPNNVCWPTQDQINTFSAELDGEFIIKNLTNSKYILWIHTVQNQLTVSYPSFIIIAASHSDIVSCVSFASSFNIQISIQSTAHSYSGRNSANNSLNINLSNLKSYFINKNVSPPTMTVETGVTWGQIYAIINNTMPNYVIVGGGDPSVGVAGYTSLGGHSSLTPRYGLSTDHIIEFYIVNANSHIVHVYNTSGQNQSIDNLFWSMKGGGASTFGVILNITFELILERVNDYDVYTMLYCEYPLYLKPVTKQEYIGYDILYGYFDYVQKDLDSLWSGYMTVNPVLDPPDFIWSFVLLYYGNSSYAKSNALPLTLLDPYNNTHCGFIEYKYFLDFQQIIPPDKNDRDIRLMNDFIPMSNLTNEYANQLLTFLNESLEQFWRFGVGVGGSATLIGGNNNLNNYPYGTTTSIGKGFRTSYFSASYACVCAINATETSQNAAIAFTNKWEKIFESFGVGIYSNEENINVDCVDCDWKEAFWGQENYDRLLKVKKEFDPGNVFWCNHCVGSDL